MNDDYNRGLITGLAMQPLCVTTATSTQDAERTGGTIISDGIDSVLFPLDLVIAKEENTNEE